MLVWMIRKCVYIWVRVLGISPLSAWLIIFSRTVAEIQQKTGMWHMMKRILDDFRCEMILSTRLWSLILFQKYSSFCGSLKPRTSVTRWTHSEGMRSAAAGLEVIQMRAEGSRFPTIRFISSTSTEADSLTSHNLTLLWKSRDRRHSSRPSKTKTTLYSPKNGFISLVSGKKTCRRPKRLSVLSSSSWPLWKEVEIWAGRPDSLSLQPSPGWTSAQRLFFQCQRLPLSAQFWWVCLVQVKVWRCHCIWLVYPLLQLSWIVSQSVSPHAHYWSLHSHSLWCRALCRFHSAVLGFPALLFLHTDTQTSSQIWSECLEGFSRVMAVRLK